MKRSTVTVVLDGEGTTWLLDLPEEASGIARALGAKIEDPPPARTGRYLQLRRVGIGIQREELQRVRSEELWRLHEWSLAERPPARDREATLFDLKVELARRLLVSCELCEWRCRVDRLAGEWGICGSDAEARVFQMFLTRGEERRVTGGVMVFLSGCTWDCVFCQYPQGLNPKAGTALHPQAFARELERFWRRGARNVHFIGGNPDQHLYPILLALNHCCAPLEVVWNSNFYGSPQTMRLLDGLVDVYLPDLRFGNEHCAQRLGAGPESWEAVTRNLQLAIAQGAEVIVRHLQLPGHFACCTEPCLRWLAQHLPQTPLNLMNGQYQPFYKAHQFEEISRPLPRQEHEAALKLARALGLALLERDQRV